MIKTGVFLDGFRKPLNEALQLAADFQCAGFQVYITQGEMLASNMSKKARADFVRRYRDLGLELSATCGDFQLNFGDAENIAAKETLLKEAILQTVDLGSRIMTTHIGGLGADPDGKKRKTMISNLKRLGDFAAENGVTLATETGLESGAVLRKIIEESDSKGIGVNFDPANLVMQGFDHIEAARELFRFIVHTHAKDGVREDGKGREVPLGQGSVNFPVYVGVLRGLGYDGAYTVERETGDDPVGDIRAAVEFLKTL